MFLTKIRLDLREPHVLECLRDCNAMHKAVMRYFESRREDAGALFRINERGGAYDLYILSKKKPDDKAENPGMKVLGTGDVSGLEKRFVPGASFRFDMIVNPTKKKGSPEVKNSKRVFLRDPSERLDWLHNKAEKNGFEIESVKEIRTLLLVGKKNSHTINTVATRYAGVLTVSDSDLFKRAWESGIGAGKSYGAGMLLLG